ncbi:hypothetical protein NDU88_007331 [Pleurodeles waltl]|uniref:Uncharacterized protein n=1 Tax=Pleurodeles waltl TaxID=8319 RepID=A0AAV7UNI5_PLEWA|nr:hypothetical protein NDU88_007331 [Pleurodeles waltl]
MAPARTPLHHLDLGQVRQHWDMVARVTAPWLLAGKKRDTDGGGARAGLKGAVPGSVADLLAALWRSLRTCQLAGCRRPLTRGSLPATETLSSLPTFSLTAWGSGLYLLLGILSLFGLQSHNAMRAP